MVTPDTHLGRPPMTKGISAISKLACANFHSLAVSLGTCACRFSPHPPRLRPAVTRPSRGRHVESHASSLSSMAQRRPVMFQEDEEEEAGPTNHKITNLSSSNFPVIGRSLDAAHSLSPQLDLYSFANLRWPGYKKKLPVTPKPSRQQCVVRSCISAHGKRAERAFPPTRASFQPGSRLGTGAAVDTEGLQAHTHTHTHTHTHRRTHTHIANKTLTCVQCTHAQSTEPPPLLALHRFGTVRPGGATGVLHTARSARRVASSAGGQSTQRQD